jgi:hypothetical protein
MEMNKLLPCPRSVHTEPRIASVFSEGLFRARNSLYFPALPWALIASALVGTVRDGS